MTQTERQAAASGVREIALSCMRRMREAGESHEMCARWISEEVNLKQQGQAAAAGKPRGVSALECILSEALRCQKDGNDISPYWLEDMCRMAADTIDALERRAEYNYAQWRDTVKRADAAEAALAEAQHQLCEAKGQA